MIIVQTILNHVIESVKTALEAQTKTTVCGAGLAVKDMNGTVVSSEIDQYSNRKYLGPTDTKGTYFYIRLNGKSSELKAGKAAKRGSCALQQEIKVPLRLVAMHKCADTRLWVDAVKAALYNTSFKGINFDGFDVVDVTINPISSNMLPWEVYKDETNKNYETFSSQWQLVSVDFELRFDLTYSKKCNNFDIC